MAFVRFIMNLLGFALLIGGTICGILGFWGVTRGTPDGWKLALVGVAAAVVGGAFMLPRAPSR